MVQVQNRSSIKSKQVNVINVSFINQGVKEKLRHPEKQTRQPLPVISGGVSRSSHGTCDKGKGLILAYQRFDNQCQSSNQCCCPVLLPESVQHVQPGDVQHTRCSGYTCSLRFLTPPLPPTSPRSWWHQYNPRLASQQVAGSISFHVYLTLTPAVGLLRGQGVGLERIFTVTPNLSRPSQDLQMLWVRSRLHVSVYIPNIQLLWSSNTRALIHSRVNRSEFQSYQRVLQPFIKTQQFFDTLNPCFYYLLQYTQIYSIYIYIILGLKLISRHGLEKSTRPFFDVILNSLFSLKYYPK